MTVPRPQKLRVAYDISRLVAGGACGGIKVHHYEFLRSFVENHSHELQLNVFCQEEIIPELDFLAEKGTHQIHSLGARDKFDPREFEKPLPPIHYWPHRPDDLIERLGMDILYAGFGFSELYTPEIPQTSLIVDVLHRTYPESLPPEEVAFRDKWYAEELKKATLVQTNSDYCKQQLVDEFGADPEKIFVIGVPVHGRFNRVEMGQLPPEIAHIPHKYFLYPANYWPHKNHELLIIAFRKFIIESGQDSYLVLTGDDNERAQELNQLAQSLGISERIRLLGKLDDSTYKAVWELSVGLVFPSLYEGYGIPLVEALYFQKPVLCSKLEVAENLLESLPTYFDPRKPIDIAGSFQRPEKPSEQRDHELIQKFDLVEETDKLVRSLSESTKSNARSN